MAIIPLPALDAKKLQELVVTDEVVFVLATEVRLALVCRAI